MFAEKFFMMSKLLGKTIETIKIGAMFKQDIHKRKVSCKDIILN